MKMKLSRSISVMLLIAAMAVAMIGCGAKKDTITQGEWSDGAQLGEGSISYTFEVVAGEKTATFEIKTDSEMVGESLLELGLVEGEDSETGLYVKTVNGVLADYDVDQTYWAFFVDGEYATKGVDSTPVTEGAVYKFEVSK